MCRDIGIGKRTRVSGNAKHGALHLSKQLLVYALGKVTSLQAQLTDRDSALTIRKKAALHTTKTLKETIRRYILVRSKLVSLQSVGQRRTNAMH